MFWCAYLNALKANILNLKIRILYFDFLLIPDDHPTSGHVEGKTLHVKFHYTPTAFEKMTKLQTCRIWKIKGRHRSWAHLILRRRQQQGEFPDLIQELKLYYKCTGLIGQICLFAGKETGKVSLVRKNKLPKFFLQSYTVKNSQAANWSKPRQSKRG